MADEHGGTSVPPLRKAQEPIHGLEEIEKEDESGETTLLDAALVKLVLNPKLFLKIMGYSKAIKS